MASIELDSQFLDGWRLDEIYQLPDPFANNSPRFIDDREYFYSKVEPNLSLTEDPVANANLKRSPDPLVVAANSPFTSPERDIHSHIGPNLGALLAFA